eukprot:gene1045-2047_t
MLGSFVMVDAEVEEEDFSTISRINIKSNDNPLGTSVITNWLQLWMSLRERILESAFFKIKCIWSLTKNISFNDIQKRLVHDAVNALTLSEIGHRSKSEKLVIKDLILGPYKSNIFFRRMKEDSLNMIANNVDFQFCDFRSIICLQGETDHTIYIVASGSVDLYYEQHVELEPKIIEDNALLRYTAVTDEKVKTFGKYIRSLGTGEVFGDLAINDKKKKRSCTVIASPDTLLLTLTKDIYVQTLQFYRVKVNHISTAAMFLKDSISFNHHSFPTLINIAYRMEHRNIAPCTNLTTINSPVNLLYFILSGEVKGFSYYVPPQSSALRLPKIADETLTAGMIIGEKEMLKRQKQYHMTYVATTRCVVFEMDGPTFVEYASSEQLRATSDFREAEKILAASSGVGGIGGGGGSGSGSGGDGMNMKMNSLMETDINSASRVLLHQMTADIVRSSKGLKITDNTDGTRPMDFELPRRLSSKGSGHFNIDNNNNSSTTTNSSSINSPSTASCLSPLSANNNNNNGGSSSLSLSLSLVSLKDQMDGTPSSPAGLFRHSSRRNFEERRPSGLLLETIDEVPKPRRSSITAVTTVDSAGHMITKRMASSRNLSKSNQNSPLAHSNTSTSTSTSNNAKKKKAALISVR